jgi:peroxiredoxin
LPSTIEEVQREFNARGLAVLAINIQEDREKVAGWVAANRVSSRVLLDVSGEVTRRYGVTGTPTTFLVGRDGKLIGKATGTRGWTTAVGRRLFTALAGS